MRWRERSIKPLGGLGPGEALVRGHVVQLGPEPMELPVKPPAGAPPVEKIAVAVIDIEEYRMGERPVRERVECLRSFRIADATGTAIVRFPEHLRDVLEVRLDAPFIAAVGGAREIYFRAVVVGDEVVVRGHVRHEVDRDAVASRRGYRDSPLTPTVEALAFLDAPAWRRRADQTAFPWLRRLLARLWRYLGRQAAPTP